MYKNLFLLVSCLLVSCLLVTACSTTDVGLPYKGGAAAPVAESATAVTVGAFSDARGEPPTWLGAIRGGFGNPLKNIESRRPVAEMTRAAFVEGLEARGVAPEPSSGSLELSGTVRQLDCNQYVRREANAMIELVVTERKSGQQRFARTYVASNVEGSALSLKTGLFASVEDLRALTEKTLDEVVDQALDDPELRAALKL